MHSAPPALDIGLCARAELWLDHSALMMLPPLGEMVTLAYLDDARGMVNADEGVSVAPSAPGFCGSTAARRRLR